MAKASPALLCFNAGELSPRLQGRTDVEKYKNGCSLLENMIPLVQGPARRRSGTRFVHEVKNSNNRTFLSSFVFSATQSYVLEWGDQYLRFYTNHGILEGPAPTIYEIATPYAAADLADDNGIFQLNIEQTGDVAYIAHAGGLYPPYKLSRLGSANWTLAPLNFIGGPFKDEDPDQVITVWASAQDGPGITLTASSAIFLPGHVGALFVLEAKSISDIKPWEVGKEWAAGTLARVGFRVYKALNNNWSGTITPTHTEGARWDGSNTIDFNGTHTTGVQWEFQDPSYGWVKITAVTSPTTATADVISLLDSETVGAPNATTKWAFGSWSDVEGWPTCVKFFRTRLVWARGQNIWMSEAGDFEKYRNRDDGGEVTAAQAISIVQPGQDPIKWMQEANDLLVGTSGSEHVISEITTTEALGPANIQTKPALPHGSRGIPALRISDSIIFVQASGKKLREVKFSFQIDGYTSADLTVLADHVTASGIIAINYQQEPNNVIWMVRADGQLVGFTFNREQDVLGFHRHIIGGGIVEAAACVPNPTGTADELWLIVNRNVNGQGKRYVEFMEAAFELGDNLADAFFVDAGLTYSGAPAATITGLDHLIGATVDVLADGATHPQVTVAADGSVTLQRQANTAQIGLPCPARWRSMRLEAGAQDGTAQGKTKRITNVTLRLENTLGGRIGSPRVMDTMSFRREGDAMNQPVPLFTGDWPVNDQPMPYPEGYERDAIIAYENTDPLPVTLLAIYPQLETQDRG